MVKLFAQQNIIDIRAKLSPDYQTLNISQDLLFYNTSDAPLKQVKLLNWIAAYKKTGTSLAFRKLENRSKDLYFAAEKDLGKLENLAIQVEGASHLSPADLNDENLFIILDKALQPNEATNIHLEYSLQLPSIAFTGYGTSPNKVSLKYFFLVPDSFDKENANRKEYNDIEETSNFGTVWSINLELPNGEFSTSNLNEAAPNSFSGELTTDPEILIQKAPFQKLIAKLNGRNTEVIFGYDLNESEQQNLEFFMPLHFRFIEQYTGVLPNKIFISEKYKNKEDFLGNSPIRFWKYNFPLFTEGEETDLDYFSILSQKVLEESFANDKNKNHWLTNGIQTYLEIQYLEKFYPQRKLLGQLPEAKILGIKPLKLFHASELELVERYGIGYHHMMTQNLDQKISEPFLKLSNFNEMAISNFESGNLLNFVSDKMGSPQFQSFLKNYLFNNRNHLLNPQDFLGQLATQSGNSSSFLKDYIQEKQRVNFNLKSFKRKNGNLLVKVKKNTELPVPFKLETFSKSGEVKRYWFDTPAKKTSNTYEIPDAEAYKMEINGGQAFPEASFRDNYIYTTGLFSNMKRIKFKLIKDIPNPEYNEIYLNPRVTFNAYDKILLGLNFKNKSFFDQKFEYSFTPYYSTGTGEITASAGVVYKIMPPESFFRTLNLGLSGSYFHYDYDLTYQKYAAYASMELSKNPRSAISRVFSLSFNHFEKDLSPALILNNDYDRYNLLNAGFGYADNKLIHEKYVGINYQLMEDFNKVSAEAFYRWEFAKNKKISFRLFAGYFLENNTRNTNFNFGISRVSDYSFSYNLVGQSATSGILSQQYVQADGGFKSYINGSVNQWITSVNIDSHVWKIFNVYADAGVYKNKAAHSKFIYDTGVKVRIIPDFLEVFLPVYSTLGFEPGFKDYASRIRFSLVLNFSALVNTLRRGWY